MQAPNDRFSVHQTSGAHAYKCLSLEDLSMQTLSLTDFISPKTRNYPTFQARGIKMAKGACMCGQVTFEFSGEPIKTVSVKVYWYRWHR